MVVAVQCSSFSRGTPPTRNNITDVARKAEFLFFIEFGVRVASGVALAGKFPSRVRHSG